MTSVYGVLNSTPTTGESLPTALSQSQSSSSLSQTLSLGSAMIGTGNVRGNVSSGDSQSWYEAMAKAWGDAMNQQANVITNLSNQVSSEGGDTPSTITQLTAESMRFSYLATNASTATTSVGDGLEQLGRKDS